MFMIMDQALYFLITIAILVFVHELGHFTAAKLTKMRVDAFAIGFGFRLFGYNKKTGFTFGRLPKVQGEDGEMKELDTEGHTDYRICIVPFGGYVKIAGMVDESNDTSFANKEPQPYEFRSKSVPAKVFVITAGVLMNFLLTLIVFWGINYSTGQKLSGTTTLSYIADSSKVYQAGFRSGDKILAVEGNAVESVEEIYAEVFINTLGKDIKVKVARDGSEQEVMVARKNLPDDELNRQFFAFEGFKPVITGVIAPKGDAKDSAAQKEFPAYFSGLKENDVVLEIDGVSQSSLEQTIGTIKSAAGDTLTLAVLRGQDTAMIAVTPNDSGRIGVSLGGYYYDGPVISKEYGFFGSLVAGFNEIGNMTVLTFTMLKNVIVGDVEFGKVFGGPVKIAQFAAKTADVGFISFLKFLALLSLSLALINILPFPVLDGGHLVIILIEGALRRELSLKVKVAVQNAGFVLLMILMAFIVYNDIISL